jgi:O-antigen/teichoic acid export membrane protein
MSDSLASHAARGATKIAVASYLSNLTAVASGIIIPRFLGKDAYGEYAFLTASFLLIGMSSRLGLRLIITRQFAPLYNSGELEKAAGLYKAYFLTNFASGLIVSAICFFFLEFACPFQISLVTFILLSLLILTWSLSESLFVLQLGVRRYGYWGLVFLLRSLTRLLLVVPGFFTGGMPGAVGGLLLGEGLTALIGHRLSSGLLPTKHIRPDFTLLWSHARLAILAFATQLADNLRRYLGVMLVAFVTLNTDLTGYYELSLRIVVLVSSSLLLTASSLMPTLSILHEQKDESRLFDWIELSTRGGLFILILIWGVFALVGRPLIVFLVGESFEPVYLLVSILLLSLPFRWIETMYDQLCNVNRRPELNIPSRIVWLLSFVALGIWGLEKWGLPGLAAAYFMSFILSCGISYLVVWRAVRVRIVMMRSLTMFLCASPFVAALFLSEGLFERIVVASISVILAFLIAHLTTSLSTNEIGALYRIAKGNITQ